MVIEDGVLFGVEARLGHLGGDGHADGVGDALPERAGGGLDAARRVRQLRMTGRLRAQLAEALDLVERHLGVAAQVQPGVEEHRAVAGRQHEAIAVQPLGMIGTVHERVTEQHGADLGAAERQAQVPALAGMHRVDREASSDGGGLGEYVFAKRHGAPRPNPKWPRLHAFLTNQLSLSGFGARVLAHGAHISRSYVRSNASATAAITGPMIRPSKPNTSRPPNSEMKVSSVGTWPWPPTSNGRIT